jgi:hypothetical protein
MDLVSVIVWIGLAAAPFAVLSGWLAGSGNLPLTTLVLGRDAWRRSATAWPRGVQEDDEVTWRFGDTAKPFAAPARPDPPSAPLEMERVRPILRVRSR